MALIVSSNSNNRKQWMLKDFLLDDIGSCSSTGFRSFPRRQCCAAAVRSLSFGGTSSKHLLNVRSRSSVSSKISNAIQRASRAVIGAVKLLPFNSPPVKEKRRRKRSSLRRSVSKKLSRMWRNDNRESEIERWISSGAAAAEKYHPTELSNETTVSTVITATSASTTSSTNSDSWSELESEFTQARSSLDENGVVEAKSRTCVTVGHESVTKASAKKEWGKDEEKEQLSPISVLRFPDEDEEIESFSTFTRKINRMEGTKEKLMHKLRRFECLSRIGKIKLEPQLSFTSTTNNTKPTSPLHVIKEEVIEEKPANRLLKLVKSRTTNSYNNVDNLLINFFQEGLAKAAGKNQSLVEDALLVEAEDWICGRSHDEVATMSWKVKEKRKVYVKDMEEGGEWMRGKSHDLEKKELCEKLEDEVFGSLVDEMMGEFSNLELLNILLM